MAATLTTAELFASAACLTPEVRRARPYTFYYQTLWFSLVGCLGWYTVPHGLDVLRRGRAARVVSFAFVLLPAAA